VKKSDEKSKQFGGDWVEAGTCLDLKGLNRELEPVLAETGDLA
jgi:hypothetical protein